MPQRGGDAPCPPSTVTSPRTSRRGSTGRWRCCWGRGTAPPPTSGARPAWPSSWRRAITCSSHTRGRTTAGMRTTSRT
ncbi:hypothetical protein AV530_013821 [Patagioenas fasciata monilis]|uniref:Uncharacterized protein n=1 Tax=Patagioenas fasciata monilis TaxID=372326 RepID=A0A1V4JT70_PATFA|nr:hypothetical protein AV530_013821 [Patagioenas fasciata monilis]